MCKHEEEEEKQGNKGQFEEHANYVRCSLGILASVVWVFAT